MGLMVSLIAFLVFCFMVLIKFLKKPKTPNSKLKLPPGPKQLPIIGNMHQLYGSPTHHLLRDLTEKHGPLMSLKTGEITNIIVTSPEIVKEIFKTHDVVFAQRPSHVLASKIISYNFLSIIFAPHGNYWRELRKICTMELLSPLRVQTFRSIREEEVLNLVRSICVQKGSIIDLSKMIFSLTYGITARAAFGKRNNDQDKFIEAVEELAKLSACFSIADMYPSIKLLQLVSGHKQKLERAQKQFDEILENIVNEHKEERKQPKIGSQGGKDDLVDVLMNIKESGSFGNSLTDTSIKAVIFDMFSAGSETSSTIVEWAMSELIKNPRVMKRAQDEVRSNFDERGNVEESRVQEIKYLQAVIKETLRLHPSAPLLVPRECSEKCEINGYDIPAKATIIVNAWAIGRDPKYWREAEKFNPERFLNSEIDFKGNDFEYIPFGGGRRICPGISFALPNIELPLAQLLFHFDWKLPGELKQEELDMTENFGVTVRRKDRLYLVPILYRHSLFK
ncbi:hypothetical protein ACH5RR_028820 [Cinchona calisaya]|uniref:Cytochrome P450 n=1 Tax=Cinchona calisaya TaxID=153742 RepID=A0ABD2YRN7_9GENT